MEDKSQKKSKLSEKQMSDIFACLMTGEEEEAFKIMETALFKDKIFIEKVAKAGEKITKMTNEKYNKFREEYFKLSIPQMINFIIDETFKGWLYRHTYIYLYRALIEGIKEPEEFVEFVIKQMEDNLEKDIDTEIFYSLSSRIENEQG